MTEELKQAERALDRMSGYLPRVYKDDIEIVRRALTQRPAAQAGGREAKCQTCNGHGLVGGHMQDGSGYGEGCPDCNPESAPLVKWASTQPAAQTDSMGMPTSCGKPVCSPDEHHPLCNLHQPTAPTDAPRTCPDACKSPEKCCNFGCQKPAQQATPDPVRPDIIERLTYHQLERDDLSLDDCLAYLASGWKKVHGRTERQMVMQLLALLAGQPATPEPVGWKPIKTSAGGREAVRNFFRSTLKRHDFDDYITGALAADFACVLGGYLQATRPAPGVPDGWHMDREGDDVIVVRHQAVGLARATNPATSMHGQILFALCDDILQDRKSLATAQAKGGDK